MKPDALPTIFKHRAPPKRRKGPATRVSLGERPPGFAEAFDHSYCKQHIGTKQEHNIPPLQKTQKQMHRQITVLIQPLLNG